MTSVSFLLPVFLLATAIAVFPGLMLFFAMSWVLITNIATIILRVTALIAAYRHTDIPTFLQPKNSSSCPTISILVPLFHEDKILPTLVKNLTALEYPTEALEIVMLLEETDQMTQSAVNAMALPPQFSTVTIPKDWLQTKPKAMNYALPFLGGDIIGIYDAEDRPETDQLLKVAQHFEYAAGNVACVQGRLDFFNSRDNWIARCFTIDYAMWFRVLLKGVERLGIPIPLGGTSVFFRRDVLIEIGGWDAHNVTEDAELGMRLARFGYRCEMLDSTTWEEANCHPLRWVRQRSRWIKGYAMTWHSHMRDPVALHRDIHTRGFLGFQTILLSGITSHISAPLFLMLWAVSFGVPMQVVSALPSWFWTAFLVTMIVGELAFYAVAILATTNSTKRHLIPYILTLPFYWMMGSVAAYKALYEMVIAPFYWDKTSHGHSDLF